MQTVITIQEDNHDLIGIAKDYPSAIDFLIKQKWLDENCEVYIDDDGNLQPIAEAFGETWLKQILCWTLNDFNNYFEGSFYLKVVKIYKAE